MQVTDFRCLHQAEIDFDPEFTLISGPNASGKTSLLEAIYFLGRGRSFRTRRLERLIRSGTERLIIFGELDIAGRRMTLGVEGSVRGIRAKLGGERAASLAELAAAFPVQIIDPEVHRLIEEGPGRRRRFLDWGVFHVEPNFIGYWQKYYQALRQRNAALKAQQPRSMVCAWDADLVRYGELVSEARRRYVTQLEIRAKRLAKDLLALDLSLAYRSGWGYRSLREALDQIWVQDQQFGVTQIGPQRAELTIRLEGFAAKDRISRGQQKLLAAILLISQIKLFPLESPIRPTLLLDDPAAELDEERLAGLIHEIRAQSVQLIVTTLHAEFAAFGAPRRRFHMDRGSVTAI